jgi:hypothetical protein
MMSNDIQYPAGCREEFAELCALSTSGELNAQETERLREHVAICDACAMLLCEYTSLAQVGVELAAELASEIQVPARYSEKKAERRFVSALHSARPNGQPQLRSGLHWPDLAGYWERTPRFTPAMAFGAAAILLLSIAGAFEIGRRIEAHSPNAMPVAAALPLSSPPPSTAPNAENSELRKRLAAAQKSVDKMTAQSAEAEKRVAELSNARATLLGQLNELGKKDQITAESLIAITGQRDALQHQLDDVSKSLDQVKQDLVRAEQDRQGALLRATALETEINDLHSEVSKASSAATNNEEFLAEDRDIRELMGARQLYIADVFDVQHDGRRSKPFGRVFYTKGRSLIFYAFDLQSQPGYHEAKAFQAWGKPDAAAAKPVSLGIFYLDSEKNRRWVVKADNPDLLAQINAVFVTVEPRGGSEKPTGKPFLAAYLHSLSPNHP